METLGTRLRKLRNDRHLTQGGLADLLGRSQSDISTWERSSGIKAQDLVEVARVLQVPILAFFEYLEDQTLLGTSMPIDWAVQHAVAKLPSTSRDCLIQFLRTVEGIPAEEVMP